MRYELRYYQLIKCYLHQLSNHDQIASDHQRYGTIMEDLRR